MPTAPAARKKSRTLSTTSAFKSFVESVLPPLPKILPLVHMTDAYAAREILTSGTIDPRRCRHFSELLSVDERLSYFFYGRAAYRPRTGEPSKNVCAYPVALIISFDTSLHAVKRVFPFDTGAAFEKRYAKYLHERMKVMDFCLGNEMDAAQRNVAQFFKTNLKYSKDEAQHLNHDPAEYEVDSYCKLISSDPDLKADNRKSSIEVQLSKTIDLAKTEILGMVLPEVLKDSDSHKILLAKYSIAPTYYIPAGGSTSENDGALISTATTILRRYM